MLDLDTILSIPLGTFDDDPGGPWLGPDRPDDRPIIEQLRDRPGYVDQLDGKI